MGANTQIRQAALDELGRYEREMFESETYWRVYREMYRITRSMNIVRYEAMVDTTSFGSRFVVEEGHRDDPEWEWESLTDAQVTELAKDLVEVIIEERTPELQEHMEYLNNHPDAGLPAALEYRLRRIPQTVDGGE